METLLILLIKIAIIGLLFYVLWWALAKIGPPEPFNKIMQVVLVIAVVIVAFWLIMGLEGLALNLKR